MSVVDDIAAVSRADAEPAPFALDTMSLAVRYTRWIASRLAPHCGQSILELGAGIGNLSPMLPGERLVLTEPDPALLSRLGDIAESPAMRERSVRVAAFDPTQEDGEAFHDESLDTVVSANVLEHIDDHVLAIATLRRLLDVTAPGRVKRIVTLVPAHPFAYGRIDLAMEHYRRYSARTLRQVYEAAIPDAECTFEGFNVVGLAGWFVAGRILHRNSVTTSTVESVERMVPFMQFADQVARTLIRRPIGQSLIGVASWQ